MKKCLFVFLGILLIASSAHALTISSPSEVPANINWSFSVELSATNTFDYVAVSLDGDKVVTVYSNSQITEDPFNGRFVIDAFTLDTDPESNAGLILYVSYMGLDYGQHTITAKEYLAGDVQSEKTASLSAFNPLPYEYRDQIRTQMNDLQDLLEHFELRIEALDELANSKESEVLALQESINAINNSLGNLETTLDELEGEDIDLDEEIEALRKSLVSMQNVAAKHEEILTELTEEKGFDFAGLFALGGSAGLGLLIIVLAVVIIALFIFIKNRMQGDGVSFDLKSDTQKKEETKAPAEEAPGEEKPAHPEHSGKWAIKDGSWKPKEKQKKFHIKDLLKKDDSS